MSKISTPGLLSVLLAVVVVGGVFGMFVLRRNAAEVNRREQLDLEGLIPVWNESKQAPDLVPVQETASPPWLDVRRKNQLATVGAFHVFHDFEFSDRIEHSGITFQNKVVEDAGKYWKGVHYDHGNGVAAADVDGDGLIDLYFVTQVGENQLWRNLGGGRFENITAAAGVSVTDPISVTASFADIDNDGDADLYVTVVRQGNHLFENDGSGRFRDISSQSGLDYKGHPSGAIFFDYDRDGLLDLFLVNVGTYTTDRLSTVPIETVSAPGGGEYTYYVGLDDGFSGHLYPERSERSILFKNAGNNRFVDVSEDVGLLDMSWSGDAHPVDGNDDGWPDLYVLNMQGHDQYYENVGGERFERRSRDVFPKTPWGSMGISVFDYDNDGRLDIYVTDMHSDMSERIGPEREKLKADVKYAADYLRSGGASIYGNAFYRSVGQGRFEEISDRIGVENYWPWGTSVGDLNADGYEDLFIASSMNFPFRYGVNSVLLNNRGNGFVDSEFILGVEPRPGGQIAKPWFELDCSGFDMTNMICQRLSGRQVIWGHLGSRSSVIIDLDDDGDLDIVTNDFNSEPMVLVSNLTERMEEVRFLKVKLVGSASNRSGLGATVKVYAGPQTYTKVLDGKSGYLSQSLLPLYFGLGDTDNVERIEVRWPSGRSQVVGGPIEINSIIEVREP